MGYKFYKNLIGDYNPVELSENEVLQNFIKATDREEAVHMMFRIKDEIVESTDYYEYWTEWEDDEWMM